MSHTTYFALRLQSSLMEELRNVVIEEGTTINQFINVAVAEKLAALRTETYFAERLEKGNVDDFLAILDKAGSEKPQDGDEILE